MTSIENIVEQKCFQLLEKAITLDATDLQFVPTPSGYSLFFKVNGKFEQLEEVIHSIADRMISFFKFLSSLDISDKRKPQSGSFHRQVNEQNYSFRVSTIPSIHFRESVVIRLQKHNYTVSLHNLSLNQKAIASLAQAASHEQGLICLSGPTGSGKTTTLYALTEFIVNTLGRHVISLEDPVETKQSHLLQVQVNERSGLTYATGLKAILRHSPDVIMIGEIRDAETAQSAVQAALSGHLVLSTLHANDAEGVYYRLLDFGISVEELRQTVVCIASQRLFQQNQERSAQFQIADKTNLQQLYSTVSNAQTEKQPSKVIQGS